METGGLISSFFFCKIYCIPDNSVNWSEFLKAKRRIKSVAERQEAEKKELVLGINSFEKPAEAAGAGAWANLISNLMFMSPGTMPTDPDMGCNIQQYEFSFVDDKKDEIQQKVTDQVRMYFPDIPLETVDVRGETLPSGKPVLIIQLIFNYSGMQDIAVVAAEKTDNIINFDVVV